MQNLQRDGHMRMAIAKGRVSYEPNSLDPAGPREDPRRGFSSFPLLDEGSKVRARPESFGDHFTQARMFWESMTEPEQRHIVAAFAFELGKCKTVAIRRRVLGQLKNVKLELSDRVAEMLGMSGEADVIRPAVPAKAVKPSPALSQIKKATETIAGRKIRLLLTDGTTDKLVTAIKRRLNEEQATVMVIAPKVAGVTTKAGKRLEADEALTGAPSCLFDAVILAPSPEETETLLDTPAAINWIRDAFAHLKMIGYAPDAAPLFEAARVPLDTAGVIALTDAGLEEFIASVKQHRIWSREEVLNK